MKTLTEPQKILLEKIKLYKYVKNSTGIFLYDDMKAVCDFKSFDGTFNALLHKGYVKHFSTMADQNTFITATK